MEGKPFALIGVNSDDSPETALAAVKKNELNWRSFQNEREGSSSISTDWNVSGWPTVVVIDAKGNIAYRGHDGHAATAAATNLVTKLENGDDEEIIEEVAEEVIEEEIVEEIIEEPANIGTEKGQTAPNITGIDLAGESFSLYDFKGQVVMVDFWGDW